MSSSAKSQTPSEASAEEITTETVKYNFADGNVILKSCDGAEFKVHDYMLKSASPVFLDTLSGNIATPIPLAETGEIVIAILDIIYFKPTDLAVYQPQPSDFEATMLRRAVSKYQLEDRIYIIGAAWAILEPPRPMTAFIWACQLMQEASAQRALMGFAKVTNENNIDPSPLKDGHTFANLIGGSAYAAYVDAYFNGGSTTLDIIVNGSTKVDWLAAARKFHLD